MKTDYIPRRLLEKESYKRYGNYAFYMAETFTLRALLTKGDKKIVLLGDAGSGKSVELRVLAEDLIEEKNLEFIPVYIELNTYVDQDLRDYISLKLQADSKAILDYPNKQKLLFLLDEFDQVLDKIKATRKIKDFMEEFAESNFVISCRSNFYSGQFSEIEKIVFLSPLNQAEIDSYCKVKLGNESNKFLEEGRTNNLSDLIPNPFFLNALINIFNADKKIPKDKAAIFARVVSLSLEQDEKRLLGKYDLAQQGSMSKIKESLAYLALIMETIQRNYITNDEMKEVFPDSQLLQIIKDLSLIRKNFSQQGDVFQFQHNNFQEYLAAERISGLPFRLILCFILALSSIKKESISKIQSVLKFTNFNLWGLKFNEVLKSILGGCERVVINKVNPSWVNTVAFLCLLRKQNDLFRYLMKYEPELTLKFEKNRLNYTVREKIFKVIFEKYTRRKTWFDRTLIDAEELASFIDSDKIYEYLFNYAKSQEHFFYRHNAIQILGNFKCLTREQKDKLAELLVNYAIDSHENPNVRHEAFYALSKLGFAQPNYIDKLIHLKDCKDEMVVSGLFHLIQSCDCIDKYIDAVVSTLVEKKEIALMDVSINLNRCIEKVKSAEAIKKILKHFTNVASNVSTFRSDDLFDEIIDKAVACYASDNSIYDSVKAAALAFTRNYLNKSVAKLRDFFLKTATASRFCNELYTEGKKDRYFYSLMAVFADDDMVSFLIKENLEGRFADRDMQMFINYLYSRNAKEVEKYIKVINDKTGKFVQSTPIDYDQIRKEKLERKIQIIFSKAQFLLELEKIFQDEKLSVINFDAFHQVLEDSYQERTQHSEFVIMEVMRILKNNPERKYDLAQLKKIIEDLDYASFTISHIYELLDGDRESKIVLSQEQIDVIAKYCSEHLNKIDFKTALTPNDEGGASGNRLAIHLWYFLRRFNLNYPETILLDMLSFDWLSGHSFVGIDYLESKLHLQKIRERILSNLKQGISVEQVLQNHLEFCKKNNIKEAVQAINAVSKNKSLREDTRLMAVETIVSFQDYDDLLQDLLADVENINILKRITQALLSKGNIHCEKILVGFLKSAATPEVFLESAKILIEYQNLEGLRFYAQHIMKTREFKESLRQGDPIEKLKDIRAIPILIKLLEFYYGFKDKIQQDQFHTLDRAILNALKNIAMQNLDSYFVVKKTLKGFIRRFGSKFEGVNFLNMVCDDIERAALVNFSVCTDIKNAMEKVVFLLG